MYNVQAPRAPFFGQYVSETMVKEFKRESIEEKKKRKKRLKEIFEIIDDYVEQA